MARRFRETADLIERNLVIVESIDFEYPRSVGHFGENYVKVRIEMKGYQAATAGGGFWTSIGRLPAPDPKLERK